MADLQVKCINKLNRDSTYESISHLGGDNFHWLRQQVIDCINSGRHTFYTQVNGKRANVAVVNGSHTSYVRTHADGQWTDNLLALPECLG